MVWYLAKKYLAVTFVLAFALALLPLVVGTMSVQETIPKSVLWSGLISPFVVYWEFRSRKLWSLYHNLRLSKFYLLGLCSGIQIAVYIVVQIWIS